ncbi:glucosamine-6-phosphate deaminase [Candidatus Woesearchaeota archaeon]|nr:glucosamine-6-phosphate deaminase [Candidatus Woesearchaeota archaeon]
MKLNIFKTKKEAAFAAAKKAAGILNKTIASKGYANFIAATGVSQFELLDNLIKKFSIDWSKISMFHLDEYIGISDSHPASFRRYLKERIIDKVSLGMVYFIKGDSEDPKKECERLGKLIKGKEIDLAFLGVGENGHIAFNEPPADFHTEKPFIIVKLDKRTRMQQLKEGWFSRLSEVPKKAISMSIKQIMKSKNIICIAYDKRKAQAVRDCFGKKISPVNPASILQKNKNAFIYLDKNSASLIS